VKGGMEEVPKNKKYEVIKGMSEGNYSIQLLCKLAGVSKSGYYKWIKRQQTPTEKQLVDKGIKKKIMECHEKLKGIYGYRRVQVWLKKTYGLHINHKRVQRLMGELEIQAVIRRNPIMERRKRTWFRITI
jgi:transposase